MTVFTLFSLAGVPTSDIAQVYFLRFKFHMIFFPLFGQQSKGTSSSCRSTELPPVRACSVVIIENRAHGIPERDHAGFRRAWCSALGHTSGGLCPAFHGFGIAESNPTHIPCSFYFHLQQVTCSWFSRTSSPVLNNFLPTALSFLTEKRGASSESTGPSLHLSALALCYNGRFGE